SNRKNAHVHRWGALFQQIGAILVRDQGHRVTLAQGGEQRNEKTMDDERARRNETDSRFGRNFPHIGWRFPEMRLVGVCLLQTAWWAKTRRARGAAARLAKIPNGCVASPRLVVVL